jgi:hypothetical protein
LLRCVLVLIGAFELRLVELVVGAALRE